MTRLENELKASIRRGDGLEIARASREMAKLKNAIYRKYKLIL